MTDRPQLRFFLDECVPDSVGRVLSDSGHFVILLREAGATGSPDPLVCALAEANDAILVSLDGDMKQIARDAGVSKGRFAQLSLLKLSCEAVHAASRVAEAMTLVEHEWMVPRQAGERRLFVEIRKSVIRTFR
ncbi:DUF5615 family PIN-like protein [Prosthecodimorpha staleyi]|uniref:DUF5615 family PIN-like protein n=1 Tax=Prosthecodimorpha staleyi TaxID=2840188 RepID=A0A947GIX5_9HYPH|nr:DUF5615 family PIN-like protein [Prosthecodimorpha staleyi]MBT9290479.1 DUF5615 family PIN-like protein [Prosthecodimorpha staleyi]